MTNQFLAVVEKERIRTGRRRGLGPADGPSICREQGSCSERHSSKRGQKSSMLLVLLNLDSEVRPGHERQVSDKNGGWKKTLGTVVSHERCWLFYRRND